MRQRYKPSSTQTVLNNIPSDQTRLSKQIKVRQANWKAHFTELVAEINTSCTVESPFVLKYLAAPAHLEAASPDLCVNLEMPRLDGVLVQKWASAPGSVADLCRYWKQLLLGLRSMHRGAGIIHGDIKDANVLVDLSTRTAKIIDFGLSRVCKGAHSIRFCKEYPHGTRSFRAPELWEEKSYGFPSDVYSLGGVFLQMLTGSVKAKLFDFQPRASSSNAQDWREEYNGRLASMVKAVGAFNKEDGELYSAVVVRDWLQKQFSGESLFAGCPGASAHQRTQLLAVVASMLALDPTERATPEQLLASPFFADNNHDHAGCEAPATKTPSTAVVVPLSEATASSLKWTWSFAMQHSLPLNSTLLAVHLVVHTSRARPLTGDDGGLCAVASLLLAARLCGHAPDLIQTVYDAACPATAAQLQLEEWAIVRQLNGALVRDFDEDAMRRVLFAL